MAAVPRVTVIVATYDWSSVLPFSVGSVLRQSFTDLEVLVVGDGCTDDSAEVVGALGDARVHWMNLPANSGHQSAPNNEGLRRATGEIVAYLGHDDLWLPHHLASAVRVLDEAGADVSYSLVACVGPGGRFVAPSLPRPARGLYSPPSGMMHRRSVTERIGGWRDYRELRTTPDVELWRRAAQTGHSFAFVPRLAALKFPASWRRDVYKTRPSHEQADWFARIEREPDLEARELVKMIADDCPAAVSYGELWRRVARETWHRLGRPSVLPWRRRGANVDAARRFKGL
jgi:glycosyltransferase involved in cell wall biosynthesis